MTAIDTGVMGELAYTEKLPNGLAVFVMKKPGFQKKAGMLAVNYGSDHIMLPGAGAAATPAGVAHFLEHKMFDMPDGRNVLQVYGELGASPNAFTSHSMTAYHFEATERFGECLELLLDFVYTPYYTPESVEKERGIIGQELSMYRDMPGMRLFEELLALTYVKHPVRLPIGGTHASVAEITARTLYDCHSAFYAPANMVLCAAGDVEPDEIVEMAARISPDRASERYIMPETGEPDCVGGLELTVDMDVPLPLFGIAVKLRRPDGVSRLEWETLIKLASECLAGMSSPLYSELYEDGLIDGAFGFDPFMFDGGSCLLFTGQSREPDAVRGRLLTEARRLSADGIPAELFERVKRSCWGARMRILDAPLDYSRQVAARYLAGEDFFWLPGIFARAGAGAAAGVLRRITEENTAIVRITR
ncbi:MAG: insulinase family protein [Oscillospiraceae bacterium]|nr:insulinase family protein [Oscillospiraceae bacterium]